MDGLLPTPPLFPWAADGSIWLVVGKMIRDKPVVKPPDTSASGECAPKVRQKLSCQRILPILGAENDVRVERGVGGRH